MDKQKNREGHEKKDNCQNLFLPGFRTEVDEAASVGRMKMQEEKKKENN